MFVLSHWFGACCFILFDSALQGWGPAPVAGDIYIYIFCIVIVFFLALYGVHPLHPQVDMQLCYFPCLARSISIFL
jgi:hypothetical protein